MQLARLNSWVSFYVASAAWATASWLCSQYTLPGGEVLATVSPAYVKVLFTPTMGNWPVPGKYKWIQLKLKVNPRN